MNYQPSGLPDYTPQDPDTAKRWRSILDAMDVHIVRIRLAQSDGGSNADVKGLGTEHITKGDVEKWLREKEAALAREDRHRHGTLLAWTVVAALAGIVAAIGGAIAAWPIVKEWLK
jgi:hypothetical protein